MIRRAKKDGIEHHKIVVESAEVSLRHYGHWTRDGRIRGLMKEAKKCLKMGRFVKSEDLVLSALRLADAFGKKGAV